MDAVEIIAACAQRQVDSFFFLLWQTFIVPLCALLKQDRRHEDNSWKLNLVKKCFSGLVASFVVCLFVCFNAIQARLRQTQSCATDLKHVVTDRIRSETPDKCIDPMKESLPQYQCASYCFQTGQSQEAAGAFKPKRLSTLFFFCSPQSN